MMYSIRSITWMWIFLHCSVAQPSAEEVELFYSIKETSLKWTSEPDKDWISIKLRMGSEALVPVYQACSRPRRRTLLSHWIERQDAHHLLLDIAFAQEEESLADQPSSLQIHLFESDTPFSRFHHGREVLDLISSRPFPAEIQMDQISLYLNRSVDLPLGSVTRRGFQLGFSFSGVCVYLASIRLYYKRCPRFASNLSQFGAAGAGSGAQFGTCVEGAVEVLTPERECQADGTWGPLQGACLCGLGHQQVNATCQACKTGFFKPATERGGCHPCPANSKTDGEGAESCDCVQGYYRLPADSLLLGCARSPSAPVNLSAHRHGDSALALLWNPPYELGGRGEVAYDVKCMQKEGESRSPWEACGHDVLFLPASAGLTDTEVNITGLNPRYDYSLSVRACNAMSAQQGVSPSSVATVTIHRWKTPVIVTLAPNWTVSDPQISPAPQEQESSLSPNLVAAASLGALLVLVVMLAGVCLVRSNHRKFRRDPEVELRLLNSVVTYRRHDNTDPDLQPISSVPGAAQLLEGLSDRLLTSLQDVLVERNKLTLGKELGKGEFASVYEGVFSPDEEVAMKVAVKTMKVGIYSREDLHTFLAEAEMMKNFDHDNVVKLLGVTLEQQQDAPLPVVLVILPFMKHRDLRRFLIATRYGDIPMFVPYQSLLHFMIDVAAGMEYLGSKGFLHRDLAARNCMLGDDLRVRVADFGLSKMIYTGNYYRQKVAVRLPIKWMSIESLSESIYTIKTDVWSFGVTMWEIVCRGRTPYPGVHSHELLDFLTSGCRLKQPDDCDSALYEVMLSCWHRDPSRRPGFSELGEKLETLLSKLPALEASQEAHYINQGLEAAAWQGDVPDPNPDSEGGAMGNTYVPAPLGAAAPPSCPLQEARGGAVLGPSVINETPGGHHWKQGEEEYEEGYMLCVKTCSALNQDSQC